MKNQLTKNIILAMLFSLSTLLVACEKPSDASEKTESISGTESSERAPIKGKTPSKAKESNLVLGASSEKASKGDMKKSDAKKGASTHKGAVTKLDVNALNALNDSFKSRDADKTAQPEKLELNVNPPAIIEQVIVAIPAELDLGTFSTSETGTGSVSLKNTSDKPVTITRAKASCGCTTSDFKNGTVLQPGESTEIGVTMNGKGRARKMSKTVTFTIEGYPSLRLPVIANTVSYVSLDKEPIQINDEVGTTLVTLTSLDGQPFLVTSILPAIAELPTEPASEVQLLMDWDMFWDVVQTTKVTIRIDHPLCSEITTNIRLTADQRQKLNKIISDRRANGNLPTKDPTRPLTGDQLARYIEGGRGNQVLKYISEGLGKYDAVNKEGIALLSVSAEAGDAETLTKLLELGAQIERVDRVNRTPLMHAARSMNPETIYLLLDAGADIQARDRLGGTPLSWASGFGSPEGVQALIDAGADANTVDSVLGYTPLLWAAGFGDSKSVAILLEAGADVNVIDTAEKRSPLMHAVRTGKIESLKLLIVAGASLTAIDKDLSTPLHIGVTSSNVSIDKIQLLVESGAEVQAKNASGETALDIAKSRTDDDAAVFVAYLI
jgi:ankyrin repeat protein